MQQPGGSLRVDGDTRFEYERLLAAHRADARDALFGQVKRLRWPSGRILLERDRKLRELLTWSAKHSSFYRDRLLHVDPSSFTLNDLSSLPVLTKDDLMDNFDALLTDQDLTRASVEQHLATQTRDGYLLGKYRVVSSGGSSGRRGLFVYDWKAWTTFASMVHRTSLARNVGSSHRMASLFSDNPSHISGALHAFAGALPGGSMMHLPMSLDLTSIIRRLNRFEPDLLQGYPTALNVLVAEARAGRLQIAPAEIRTSGELVTEMLRDAVRDLWQVEICDNWGASEGVYTSSCPTGAMHLPDDLTIVETLDGQGQPVRAGEPASKIYLTNLYNFAQPLIRYEITDSMTIETDPCSCGSSHSRVATLGGRLSDLFVYPSGATLHAAALESALFQDPGVIEYRIWQTADGVKVVVRTEGQPDLTTIRGRLCETLSKAGIGSPGVMVGVAEQLDRLWSGKTPRFVALGAKIGFPELEWLGSN